VSLLLLLAAGIGAGCAADRLVVPASDWAGVPAPERTKIDQATTADLAEARAEAKAANASLAELQRTQPAPKGAAAAPVKAEPPPPATDDAAWASEVQTHDRQRLAALAKIDADNADVRRADMVWRQRWVEEANDKVEMVECQRELTRAQVIDRNLTGDDTYETAPLRGQFSKAQVRWYKAAQDAGNARSDLARAVGALTMAKEAYAQLMRNGPGGSMIASAPASVEAPPPALTLPSWRVAREDIRLRRGLRHFIDESNGSQQIKIPPLHISAALMSWKPPAAKPEAEATPVKAPAAQVASAGATVSVATPAKVAPAPAAAAKPAVATAPATATKPAVATAPATAAKPAAATMATAVPTATRPTVTPTATAAATSPAKPTATASPAAQGTPATAVATKASPAPSTKPAAHWDDALETPAKPAAPAQQPVAAKPAVPAQQPVAAKPIEH
jgi:hypothetical protein